MRRLRIQNPSLEHTYKSYLGADYAVADGTAVTFLSNNSFAANDQLIFGEPREELTELKKLSSVSGATSGILASALKFAHSKGTSIYRSLWDFVYIEADYGSGFAVISQSPIQWDNKDNETIYYDTNGSNSTSYRFRFYNSVTTTYSEYSPTLTGAQPARNTVGYMLTQIRLIAGDRERKIVSDEELIRVLNRAQDIVYAHNPKYWFLYIDSEKEDNGITALTTVKRYTLAIYTTLGHIARIKFRYTNGSMDQKYDLEFKNDTEFDSLDWNYNKPALDYPVMYKLLPADSSSEQGYFEVDTLMQNTAVGKFYPVYYEKMADLETVDDITQIPLPAILEDYGISYIFSLKGNENKAKQYMDQFLGPPDRREGIEDISGLKLLDDMDNNRKRGVSQPRSLSVFKGRKGRFSGNKARAYVTDYIKENFW
jgi:hypothetical protein